MVSRLQWTRSQGLRSSDTLLEVCSPRRSRTSCHPPLSLWHSDWFSSSCHCQLNTCPCSITIILETCKDCKPKSLQIFALMFNEFASAVFTLLLYSLSPNTHAWKPHKYDSRLKQYSKQEFPPQFHAQHCPSKANPSSHRKTHYSDFRGVTIPAGEEKKGIQCHHPLTQQV